MTKLILPLKKLHPDELHPEELFLSQGKNNFLGNDELVIDSVSYIFNRKIVQDQFWKHH
jgi:hypothetical protein